MKRLLIAGCGDLGIRLAKAVGANWQVTGLRRSPRPDFNRVTDGDLQWIAADLTDPASLGVLNHQVFDAVVFCPSPPRRDEAHYRAIFLQGQDNLQRALPHWPARAVFVSSTAVYGGQDGECLDELSDTTPLDFNGRVLLQAEAAWRAFAPPASVVIRLAGIYGPGRFRMFEAARLGQIATSDIRLGNRIHIDDAAAMIAAVLDAEDPPQLLNGVDCCAATQGEVIQYLRALLQQGGIQVADAPATASKFVENAPHRRIASVYAEHLKLAWRHTDFRSGYAELLTDYLNELDSISDSRPPSS